MGEMLLFGKIIVPFELMLQFDIKYYLKMLNLL